MRLRFWTPILSLFLFAFVAGPLARDTQPPQTGGQQPQAGGAPQRGGPGAQGRGGRGGARPANARKRVLAWADTRNGQAQHAFTSHALAVIERLGYESGAYDTEIRTDSHIIAMQPKKTTGEPASGGPTLANVDAIFFIGHRDVPIDEAQKAELQAFVRDQGKGFVATHQGLTALDTWPAFGEFIGGRYDGHPWGVTPGTLMNEAPDFPATRHFPPTFALTDEFYQPKDFSRTRSRVLLRLDVSKLPANANYRLNGDMPIAWAHMYGKGRVFYSSLGHDASYWDNRDVAQMYFEALKWALGLTDGDVTPRPMPATSQP